MKIGDHHQPSSGRRRRYLVSVSPGDLVVHRVADQGRVPLDLTLLEEGGKRHQTASVG
jgi:hypothetical protein